MSEDNYHNRFDKHISSTQSPNKVRVDDVTKTSTDRLCSCPGSKAGKVKIDIDEHIQGCRFRKRSRSSQYGRQTSVIPNKFVDGCRLGEDF